MSISKFIARRFNRNNNLNVVSSQEGLPAAKPGIKTNARRRNYSINLNVENCEERVVPVVMASLVGGALTFMAQEYAAKPFLDNIFGGSNEAEFKAIQEKLNALQTQVSKLQDSVNVGQLADMKRELKISAIDRYWGELQSALDDKIKGKPWSKTALDGLTKNIIDNLNYTLTTFDQAIAGNSVISSLPLMKVFSNAIKGTVSVSPTDTRSSSPFLTTNYSTSMAGAFNYFLDEKAKAMILLANAYEYTGQHERANYTIQHFASPYATNSQAKAQWAQQIKTLPKFIIPDFMIVDTGTNRGWSQFKLQVSGIHYQSSDNPWYVAWHHIPDYFAAHRSLNNKKVEHITKWSVDLRDQLRSAVDAEIKSGLSFHWHMKPTVPDLGNPAEFYVSRGFNNIYGSDVWVDYYGAAGKVKPGGNWLKVGGTLPTSYAVFYETVKTGDFFV